VLTERDPRAELESNFVLIELDHRAIHGPRTLGLLGAQPIRLIQAGRHGLQVLPVLLGQSLLEHAQAPASQLDTPDPSLVYAQCALIAGRPLNAGCALLDRCSLGGLSRRSLTAARDGSSRATRRAFT